MSSNNLSLSSLKPGTKILFANMPGDGHFNPLTGLACHLKKIGCDVRWYTSERYKDKIDQLRIPFYGLQKAKDSFAELTSKESHLKREKQKTAVGKLNYDIINLFILRGAEFYEDIKVLYEEFRFEVLVADICFTGIPFVKDLLKIPVVSIGVLPLANRSKDLPPSGLGMTPSYSFLGRLKQAFLRKLAKNVLFAKSNKVLRNELERYGITDHDRFVFDVLYAKSDLVLQSGSPGFEYRRTDMSPKIKFVGALLPCSNRRKKTYWFDERLLTYKKVILVTQGTVETDVEKILVPTLEAFKNTNVLVVATTGGTGTANLRKRFPQKNLIIEDFIPFEAVMPHVQAYITNGGYGGVMLGIQHNLPLIVAGVHEGKNEINARIGYFNLGVNLKTETPRPIQIFSAVTKVLKNGVYKESVKKLNKELATYQPALLAEKYLAEVLQTNRKVSVVKEKAMTAFYEPEPIY